MTGRLAARLLFRVVCANGEPPTRHHPYERRYGKAEAVSDRQYADSHYCDSQPHAVQRSSDNGETWEAI